MNFRMSQIVPGCQILWLISSVTDCQCGSDFNTFGKNLMYC